MPDRALREARGESERIFLSRVDALFERQPAREPIGDQQAHSVFDPVPVSRLPPDRVGSEAAGEPNENGGRWPRREHRPHRVVWRSHHSGVLQCVDDVVPVLHEGRITARRIAQGEEIDGRQWRPELAEVVDPEIERQIPLLPHEVATLQNFRLPARGRDHRLKLEVFLCIQWRPLRQTDVPFHIVQGQGLDERLRWRGYGEVQRSIVRQRAIQATAAAVNPGTYATKHLFSSWSVTSLIGPTSAAARRAFASADRLRSSSPITRRKEDEYFWLPCPCFTRHLEMTSGQPRRCARRPNSTSSPPYPMNSSESNPSESSAHRRRKTQTNGM